MKKVLFVLFAAVLFGSMISCNKKAEEVEDKEAPIVEAEPETPVIEETEALLPEDLGLEKWETYRVDSPEGLRVRSSNSLDGKVINKYPDKLPVRIVEIDPTPVEIDGIKSFWVKIGHNIDPDGWVFGGYLKKLEPMPDDGKNENDYTYDDFKTSYGNLKPEDIQDDWTSFYIFSKDYVVEKQQLFLDLYDMYTIINEKTYKIFTGLYQNNNNEEGAFIVKMNPEETEVLELLIELNNGHRILFLKPWSKTSEFLSVGNWFESEAFYYISKNDVTQRLYWSDDEY